MLPSSALERPEFVEGGSTGNAGAVVGSVPTLPTADLQPVAQPDYLPTPSFTASVGAGMVSDTVTGDIYRHLSRGNYTRDFSFNAGEYFLRFEEQNPNEVQALTKDQRAVLERTVNLKNFNDMLEEFNTKRLTNMMSEVHPVANILGSVVDPIDIVPVGTVTGAARVFRGVSSGSKVATSAVTRRTVLDRLALNTSAGLFLGANAEAVMSLDKGEYEYGNVMTFGLMRAGEGVPELWKRFKSVQPNLPSRTIAGLETAGIGKLSDVTEAAQKWADTIGAKVPTSIPDAASTSAAAADLVRRVETHSAQSAAKLRSAFSDPALVQNADLQAIRDAIPVPLNTGDDLAAFVESATARVTLVGADSAKLKHLVPTLERVVQKYLPDGTRVVLSSSAAPGMHGFTTAIGDGVHLLNLNPTKRGVQLTDTMFHELGHNVMTEGYAKAPAEVVAQMRAGYDEVMRLAKSRKSVDAEAVVYGLRSIHDATGEVVRVGEAQMVKRGNGTFNSVASEVYGDLYAPGGVGTFEEWSAEQFVKGVQQELLQDAVSLGVDPTLLKYAAVTAKKLTGLADDLKKFVEPVPGFNELLAAARKEGAVYDEAAKLAADVSGTEFINPKLMLPNKMQTLVYAEGWLGKGWPALFDRMRNLGTTASEWAEKLVVDATSAESMTAVNHAVRVRRELGSRAQSIEQGIAKATGFNRVQQFTNRTKFREEYARLTEGLHYALQEAHQATVKGLPLPDIADARVRDLVKQYVDSGFAEAALKEARESGLITADEVAESAYYTPTRHDAASIHKYVESGGSLDDVHKVYAQQFARMFPYLSEEQVQQAAKRTVTNITDPLYRGAKPGIFMGTTKDEIEHVMNNIGLSDTQMKEFSMYFDKTLDDAGKPKNFKKKLDWNVFDKVQLDDGTELGITDFMDKNVTRNLDAYTRNLAGRTALARQGLNTPAAIEDMIAKVAQDSSNPVETRELFQHVVDNLLGLPVGEKLPDLLQTIGGMSAFISLRNMGLFNVVDTATLAHQHGMIRTIKAMASGGVNLKGVTRADAQTLQDIVKSQIVSDGRWRAVRDFMDDGFAVPNDTLHEAVQHTTQSLGHLTGAEAVRKYLVGLNANLTADSLFRAVQGDTGMRSMLQRFGLNDDLFQKIAADFNKHGNQPELWSAEARTSAINIMQNMSDHVVQKNRLGEIPAFFQFSPMARVLFPYMNFVAGAHNKILRRTYKQEGMGSLLMLASYQVPMAAMMSATSNVLSGEEWDKNLAQKTAGSLPMAGWLGFMMDVYDRGFQSPVAMFAYLQKTHEAVSSIAQGNPSVEKIAGITPLAPLLGVKLFGNLMDELSGQHERQREVAAEKAARTREENQLK